MTVLGFKKGLMNNNTIFNSINFVPGTMLNTLQMLTLITNLYPWRYTLCLFPFLWDKERLNDLSVVTKLVGSGDMEGWIDGWMDGWMDGWRKEGWKGSWMDGGREDRECGWVPGWKQGRNEAWMKEGRMEDDWMDVLLNQTSVHSPAHSKANLLTQGCAEGKSRICCGHQTRNPEQLMLRKPKLPWWVSGKTF